jgi:hypothetical protein
LAIPILDGVLSTVTTAVDKIWPDKGDALAANVEREKFKSDLQLAVIQQALTEKQMLFQDTEGARQLAKAELAAQQVPSWARGFQVMGRPFALYLTVSMYAWTKLGPLVGNLLGVQVPPIELTTQDYYLIGTVFVFLFGARSLEKIKGKA